MLILDTIIVLLFMAAIYCFAIYPYLIRLFAKFFPSSRITDENLRLPISIILAVHNEEEVIERCLESILALEHPRDMIEILIGSDGSTDRTNEIIEGYCRQYSFIKFYPYSERRGKMPVLNDLTKNAKGEIFFFADADITHSPNTLRSQMRHFADPSAGAVGGLYLMHAESGKGVYSSEKEYASLEQQVRINEGIFGSSIGVFGGNYSIRREFWQALPDPLVHDDLFVALSVISQGKRVIYDSESHSYDQYERTLEEEFRRKSRSASRGYHTIAFFPELIGPRGGKNSFQLWSHKILRWLSPFISIVIFLLALLGKFLYADSYYANIFYTSIIYTGVALAFLTFIGWLFERKHIRVPIVRQIAWFSIMNIAYIAGTIKYLFKTDEVAWKKASRTTKLSTFAVKEAINTK